MKTIAIQGTAGSYHDIAARSYFKGEEIQTIDCLTFKSVISEIQKNPDIIGLIAIENTIAGSLLQNHELIRKSEFSVVGEYKLHISHCLAALKGQQLQDIEEINSHPIALMQCADFLETMPKAKIVEKGDTATSARWIAETNALGHAAICSKQAADIYGLQVLSESIETNKRNFTRFLVVADQRASRTTPRVKDIDKSSIVFTLPHAEGSLSMILAVLSFYNMNLSKIQSLPIIGHEWEYMFYVDLTFENMLRYKQALDAIRPLTSELKILGEYTKSEQ